MKTRVCLKYFVNGCSSNQDLQCKSRLKLVFLRSVIRERRGWGMVLAAKNKKCVTELWSDFSVIVVTF